MRLPFVLRGRYENLYRQLCAEVNYTGKLHVENTVLRDELEKATRKRDENGRYVSRGK